MTTTKKLCAIAGIIGLLLGGMTNVWAQQMEEEWITLFDGQTLNNWKASENPGTFSVENGKIVVDGPRAHLFYVGPVEDHDFQNFEFKADVMTTEGSNSGIYFHTEYQEEGWPEKGYEVQVNNTHDDPRKTASLYAIKDVMNDAPARDGEWFTMYVKVEDRDITIKLDGETMIEYTEPEEVDREGRVLDSGTFALQGHDPESKLYYKNIRVKPLN
ncbi:3-keto-disaccharide hydrolase [Fodinibius sediminis]|uniref:3-keto-alpha-glucoside-1,2-lyase/3-keto-2-hydroxy-glucal hydratase domain-containing protein n=1 Tax=Fodinibius sediminis TaxID=1214077 RepID=A0A521AYZ2_9BACT|nr:DUF1080 domain-containing protein [Fodinibius sediminis]SMO40035.1 protein of unknown function [Fodinibius sediminis]